MSASNNFLYPIVSFHVKQAELDWMIYIDPTRVSISSLPSKHYDEYTVLSNTVVTPMLKIYDNYAPASGVLGFMSVEGVRLSSVLRKFDINYPRTVAHGWGDNTQMTFGKKYVLKSAMSARSLGKAVVDRETFISMSNFIIGRKHLPMEKAAKEFNEVFDINVGRVLNNRESEKHLLYKNFVNSTLVIQDYVNIEREYRYYCFNTGKPKSSFVYLRTGCRIDVKEEEDTYRVTTRTVPKQLLDKLDKLVKYYHLPWIAVDIYKDTEGNWGVFEMDMNFQYLDIPELVGDIKNLSTEAIIHTIREVNPYVRKIADSASTINNV